MNDNDGGEEDDDADDNGDGYGDDDGEGDERIGGMELEWKEELCPKEENDNEIT